MVHLQHARLSCLMKSKSLIRPQGHCAVEIAMPSTCCAARLIPEAKDVEMLDPIVTSDTSDDDEEECEGPFHFMLSIVTFKYQPTFGFFRKPVLGAL